MLVLRSQPTESSDELWTAVSRRDEKADGKFVYAVKTTGVYCRPSCRSRLPLRGNVEFFADLADAAKAGYRACKRCRPDHGDPRRELDRMLVRACRLLESEDRVTGERIATELGVSQHYFHRFFKQRTGVTPQQYRRRVLAERAKAELPNAGSVTEAVFAAGYSSSSRFYESAGRELGMTPKDLQKGARERPVQYATRACSLGRLLVAWTEHGVCDVHFGDSDGDLAEILAERLPGAILTRAAVPTWVDDIVELTERPHTKHVPLDIQGTAFQQRVWQELRRIPVGETRSYGDIARAIGAPEAARAVAHACAQNRLAVVVPCHRVVAATGDLSGYRWGPNRKRALLDRETRAGAEARPR
jgi:AraC family transcriptional regulator of adaptative response/methylated-DNA-[protein]-cysteine methyltransferase